MTNNRKDVRMKRKKADELLEGVKHRILEVNSDDRFICKITRAVVFGSYVNDPEKDTLGDLDIALNIVDLYPAEHPLYQAKMSEFKGSDWLLELYWPSEEVMRYVRNRSGYISIHRFGTDDPAIFSKDILELDVGNGVNFKDYRENGFAAGELDVGTGIHRSRSNLS